MEQVLYEKQHTRKLKSVCCSKDYEKAQFSMWSETSTLFITLDTDHVFAWSGKFLREAAFLEE